MLRALHVCRCGPATAKHQVHHSLSCSVFKGFVSRQNSRNDSNRGSMFTNATPAVTSNHNPCQIVQQDILPSSAGLATSLNLHGQLLCRTVYDDDDDYHEQWAGFMLLRLMVDDDDQHVISIIFRAIPLHLVLTSSSTYSRSIDWLFVLPRRTTLNIFWC